MSVSVNESPRNLAAYSKFAAFPVGAAALAAATLKTKVAAVVGGVFGLAVLAGSTFHSFAAEKSWSKAVTILSSASTVAVGIVLVASRFFEPAARVVATAAGLSSSVHVGAASVGLFVATVALKSVIAAISNRATVVQDSQVDTTTETGAAAQSGSTSQTAENNA